MPDVIVVDIRNHQSDFVSSLVDANGNTVSITSVDLTHTKVTIKKWKR